NVLLFLLRPRPPRCTLIPYTTLFRSRSHRTQEEIDTMIIDLSGKTAIVTGSTGGIGLAIAEGLAKAGAQVTVVGREQSRVDAARSEEHTSELQSRENLVCRLLLEKKK